MPDAAGDRLRLVQLVVARMCHDLGGPVGTVEGALSLVSAGSEEALEVATEAAVALRQRLTLCRAAWGGGLGDSTLAELLALLDGQVAAGRAKVVVEAGEGGELGPGTVFPAPLAQIVLNAVLLAGEALPRGGRVRLSGSPGQLIAVLPEGAGAAWPPGLAAALAEEGSAPGASTEPRALRAPMLAALAADLKVPLALGLGGLGGGGPAPLLIGPLPPTPH